MIHATLCYIIRDGQVLLIKKLQGFGKGRWNGPGGKLKQGEHSADCAIRETFEETGLLVFGPEHRGRLYFYFEGDKDEPGWMVDVFLATDWTGRPRPSQECEPGWWPLAALPSTDMWPDDQYWLPLFLTGRHFEGRFWFGPEAKTVLRHEINEVNA